MAVASVSDDTFDSEVIGSSTPVIVDFWAEWCGPCRQVSAHFEALAEELGDRVKVVKLNIDDNPGTTGRFGVRGLPTFMIFQDGQVTATHLGAMSKGRMIEWLNPRRSGLTLIDLTLIERNTAMALAEITDDNFDAEVLGADGPVVVDFWAEWCSSCKKMLPDFESLAGDLQGQVKMVKFNADENPMTPGKFGIRGLPTMMIFNGGKLVATKTGAMTKSKIAEWVKESAGA